MRRRCGHLAVTLLLSLLVAPPLQLVQPLQLPPPNRASPSSRRVSVREYLEELVVSESLSEVVCDEHVWRQDALERRLGGLWKGSHATAPLSFMEIDCGGRAAASSDPPVIILHGLLGSGRNFQGWATELAAMLERPRRVLLLDMRNHGESPHMPKMGYLDMAADVVRFMQHQHIPSACIIGHSMGGKVAAAMAVLFPEKVDSLGVLDIAPVCYEKSRGTSGVWTEVNTLMTALHEMPILRSASSSSGVLDSEERAGTLAGKKDADEWLRSRAGIEDDSLRAFALTNVVVDRDAASRESRLRWKIGIDTIWSSLGVLGGFDIGQGLKDPASKLGLSYPGAAFFVAGSRSEFIRSSHLSEIAALFPNFKLASIKGAGHWLHHENPKESQLMVKSFLDR